MCCCRFAIERTGNKELGVGNCLAWRVDFFAFACLAIGMRKGDANAVQTAAAKGWHIWLQEGSCFLMLQKEDSARWNLGTYLQRKKWYSEQKRFFFAFLMFHMQFFVKIRDAFVLLFQPFFVQEKNSWNWGSVCLRHEGLFLKNDPPIFFILPAERWTQAEVYCCLNVRALACLKLALAGGQRTNSMFQRSLVSFFSL